MIHDLGNHYYKDDERGYFCDPCDGKMYQPNMLYFDTLEDCEENERYEESYSIQASELRWESYCSW